MGETELGQTLFFLAAIFLSTLIVGTILVRARIPMILSALFVGIGIHYLPQASLLKTPVYQTIFSFLSDLGVLFLLFYIGLQIDVKKMRTMSSDIVTLTVLNTVIPFIFGMAAMLLFGYGWMIAFVIGMTRMPTAEAVIVPILDEFKMIKTKIGTFIVGAGVLDDIIEVFLVAFVSVWIGIRAGEESGSDEIIILTFGVIAFLLFSWIMYRYFFPLFRRIIPQNAASLLILSLMILFIFGTFSEKTEIGMVVGAIFAGIVIKPILTHTHPAGETIQKIVSLLSYGFFGILFFFWIGFNIDMAGFMKEPMLAIVLYLAGTLGKLLGAMLMVPLKKMTFKEALITGVGLDARLTTEIIVAQLLFSANIIDTHLFTALVAASSFTALTVPLLFSLLVRWFGKDIQEEPPTKLPSTTRQWYTTPLKTVLQQLHTDPRKGLPEEEAKDRLRRYGTNELIKIPPTPWYVILFRQFTDTLILILIIAAAVSASIGEITDAVTIMIIVILNGILGFVQEYNAEKEIDALKNMLRPSAKVIRDGKEKIIDAKTIVPGDIVLLEIGDHVPADLRLIEISNLKVDESALTGESTAVYKSTDSLLQQTPLAQQSNMAWMGTTVVNGWGKGVVVATGMQSEFGKIATMTQSVEHKPTHLQKKLAKLGKKLGLYSVLISILVALTGWLSGKDLTEMFLTGVSLAVAVVPEGLPAVVTITLALGIKAMVKQKALLRRLQAAETLGSATVICTDKTGTLTKNEMTVKEIWLPHEKLHVTGIGYDPAGHFEKDGKRHDYKHDQALQLFLKTGLRCNHAALQKEKTGWKIIGEPTEASLIVAAYKAWMSQDAKTKVVSEFSFNSERKRMSVVYKENGTLVAYVKGAPEVILERSTQILINGKTVPLDKEWKSKITHVFETMAEQGLRTLALAYRKLPENISLNADKVETELVFLGIAGIIDPPHEEVPEAIQAAATAGVKVIMITGDNPKTAKAIASEVGLFVDEALTAASLDKMNDKTLQDKLRKSVLFARARPADKLRIVKNLQQMHEITAMTGDGVNDAPALKQADIGIAMGQKGTDVAKSASDMVLLDDNFATIIRALKEGRRQYDNIQKFVRYLLSSNTGEIIAIFVNILLGGSLILIPVQILWMNLVTDGMTAVALGLEPAEKDIMHRPPRPEDKPILDRYSIVMILVLGTYIGLATLWLYHHYLTSDVENAVVLAQTVAFTGIIILEKVNVFNFRSLSGPIALTTGWFSNKWVLLAVIATISLQVCAVYLPFLQNILHTTALRWQEWGMIAAAALPLFIITETFKYFTYKGRE